MVGGLDQDSREAIVDAISRAEDLTSGEIRVHIQSKCRGDVMRKALRIFRRLRMERTRERNGVLVFIALDSRRFAILGDRGIHECVGDGFWGKTRDIMGSYFAKGLIKEGVVAGVMSVGEQLKKFFPAKSQDVNELPDKVTES